VFWIAGPIFFGIADEIPNLLKRVSKPRILIIRMRLVPFLDITGASALESLVKECRLQKIDVIFSAVQDQPKEILSGFDKDWSHVSYATDYEEALAKAKDLNRI